MYIYIYSIDHDPNYNVSKCIAFTEGRATNGRLDETPKNSKSESIGVVRKSDADSSARPTTECVGVHCC